MKTKRLFAGLACAVLGLAALAGVGTSSKTTEATGTPASYTVTFKTNSGDGTGADTKTAISSIVSGGAEYLSAVTTATKAYYNGGDGAKLGTSSASGTFTFSLSTKGKVKATSVVVRAKLYSSSKAATLNVNSVGTQSLTSSFADYTYAVSGSITSLSFVSNKYIWLSSFTVNYTAEATKTLTPSSESKSLCVGETSSAITFTASEFTLDHVAVDTAHSDYDSSIASASIADNALTITGLKAGTTEVKVDGYSDATTIGASCTIAVAVSELSLAVSPVNTTIKTSTDTYTSYRNVTLTVSNLLPGATATYSYAIEGDVTVSDGEASNLFVITAPKAAGVSTITWTVNDGNGHTATATTVANVVAPTVTLNPSSVSTGLNDGPVDVEITIANFGSGLTYSAVASAEGIADVSASSAGLTITPKTVSPENFKVTVTVTDSDGRSASADLPVSISNIITESVRILGNQDEGEGVFAENKGTEDVVWNSTYLTVNGYNNGATSSIRTAINYDPWRLYSGNKLSFEPGYGATVSTILITATESKYSPSSTLSLTNAKITVSGLVGTITPTDATKPVVIQATSQIRFASLIVNLVLTPVANWAGKVVEDLTVACESTSGPTASDVLKNAWKSVYDAAGASLTASDIAEIKAATPSADGNLLEKAVAKYSYIINKYGAAAFEGFGGDYINIATAGSSLLGGNDSVEIDGTTAMIVIGALAVTTIAGLVIVRRRKEA